MINLKHKFTTTKLKVQIANILFYTCTEVLSRLVILVPRLFCLLISFVQLFFEVGHRFSFWCSSSEHNEILAQKASQPDKLNIFNRLFMEATQCITCKAIQSSIYTAFLTGNPSQPSSSNSSSTSQKKFLTLNQISSISLHCSNGIGHKNEQRISSCHLQQKLLLNVTFH